MRLRHCLDRKVFWVSEKHVASDIRSYGRTAVVTASARWT
ncbi:hypothetical protein Enr13x_72040 [Stieleria neptunia]|uniref:Uncharacterized protein n=1 Tax=Stieleria neptunia TaxID=2527979 RepID=A0A518I2F2_9BACT|nr:hypothetical protein Enr13x_72040 [Stieleria neptunia]